MRAGLAAALAALALAVPAGTARAGLVAAFEVPGAGGTDLTLVDAETGETRALPAGVNTYQAELHPSLSADGRYLLFERSAILADLNGRFRRTGPVTTYLADLVAGGVHVAATDIVAGTPLQAGTPSFATGVDGLEAWAGPTGAPSTGGIALDLYQPNTTDLEFLQRPAISIGQVPHQASASFWVNPVAVGSGATGGPNRLVGLVVRNVNDDEGVGAGFIAQAGQGSRLVAGPIASFRMAIRSQDRLTVVDTPDHFISIAPDGSQGSAPSTVNSLTNPPTDPAWSADGNLLYFLRQDPGSGTGSRDLSVLDLHPGVQHVTNAIATRPLPTDPSLAAIVRAYGNLTVGPDLGEPTVLVLCPAACQANIVKGRLVPLIPVSAQRIGILVQRVIGTHRVFGQKLPLLEPVGRVPLGLRHRGSHRIAWDGRVGGVRLKPGRYAITFRALDAKGRVVQTTDPGYLVVRAKLPVVR